MRLNCDFTGKVCVVTGASRGLGTQVARDFAAGGGKVVGAGRNTTALAALKAEIEAAGGQFIGVEAELSRVEDCRKLIDTALDAHGQIDVLVNNVATTGQHKFIRDLEPSEWQAAIDTNLTSAYACTHYAVGSMMERKQGAIIHVSSSGTSYPSPRRSDYLATKGGMIQLTRVLAHELGPFNIRVNTVTPGFMMGIRAIEAQTLHAERRGITLEEVAKEFASNAALQRALPEQDVSNMICFLTSDFGLNITAQNIHVDAGLAFN